MLGLSICRETGRRRWQDPAAGCCLETHNEEADARIAAENRADTAEAWARELEAEFELR